MWGNDIVEPLDSIQESLDVVHAYFFIELFTFGLPGLDIFSVLTSFGRWWWGSN